MTVEKRKKGNKTIYAVKTWALGKIVFLSPNRKGAEYWIKKNR